MAVPFRRARGWTPACMLAAWLLVAPAPASACDFGTVGWPILAESASDIFIAEVVKGPFFREAGDVRRHPNPWERDPVELAVQRRYRGTVPDELTAYTMECPPAPPLVEGDSYLILGYRRGDRLYVGHGTLAIPESLDEEEGLLREALKYLDNLAAGRPQTFVAIIIIADDSAPNTWPSGYVLRADPVDGGSPTIVRGPGRFRSVLDPGEYVFSLCLPGEATGPSWLVRLTEGTVPLMAFLRMNGVWREARPEPADCR